MTYAGGKNGAGVYQQIINLIPPHDLYVEPFAGSAAIYRMKRKSASSIIRDVDASAIDRLLHFDHGSTTVRKGDARSWLNSRKFHPQTFIYLDPPYPFSCRSTERDIYKHEMKDQDHYLLLETITKLPCMVMISSYWNELYAEKLKGWSTHSFTGQTRGGPKTEWLWYNYPKPTILHDTQYLGDTFRERERIKKKARRWKSNFKKLPTTEQQAILTAMFDDNGRILSPFLTMADSGTDLSGDITRYSEAAE